jgi:hypothetical protein
MRVKTYETYCPSTWDELTAEVQKTELLSLLDALGQIDRRTWGDSGRADWGTASPPTVATIAKLALVGEGTASLTCDETRVRFLCGLCHGIPSFGRNIAKPRREQFESTMLRWGYQFLPFEGLNPIDALARHYFLIRCREKVPEVRDHPEWIDLDDHLARIYGLPHREFFAVAFTLFIMASMGPSVRISDLVAHAGNPADLTHRVERVLAVIGRMPEQFQELYRSSSGKYQDAVFPQVEYNILRDYPVIVCPHDHDLLYVPSLQFLSRRLTTGLMYDVLNDFAEEERVNHSQNPNPLANRMSRFWGELLERYVTRQLQSAWSKTRVVPKEAYMDANKGGPDAVVIERPGTTFVEVKLHQPPPKCQTSGDIGLMAGELRQGVAKGHYQNLKAISLVRSGQLSIPGITPMTNIRSLVICPEPIPWLDLPQMQSAFREALMYWVHKKEFEGVVDTDCTVLGLDELEMMVPYLKRAAGLFSILREYQAYRETTAPVTGEGSEMEVMDYYFGLWFGREWQARGRHGILRNPLLDGLLAEMRDEVHEAYGWSG